MRYDSDCPQILRDFLAYHETIKGQSPKTISEYYLDLRMFFRFMKLMRAGMPVRSRLDEITIRDVDLEFIRSITTSDIFEFLSYLANDRTENPDAARPAYGITPTARARKLSAIKSFYKYLTVRTKQLTVNPVADMEYPKLRKSLPKYLTYEQSAALLKAVSGPNQKRDYAIVMLFLKCGSISPTSMKIAFVWLAKETRNGWSILGLLAERPLTTTWLNATKKSCLTIALSLGPGITTESA